MDGRSPISLKACECANNFRDAAEERDRDLVEVLAIQGEFAPMQLVLSSKSEQEKSK